MKLIIRTPPFASFEFTIGCPSNEETSRQPCPILEIQQNHIKHWSYCWYCWPHRWITHTLFAYILIGQNISNPLPSTCNIDLNTPTQNWFTGFNHLENMKVNGKDCPIYYGKSKPCLKPPTRKVLHLRGMKSMDGGKKTGGMTWVDCWVVRAMERYTFRYFHIAMENGP